MAGGALVLENSFLQPDAVFDRMVQERVTGFAGVPSTFAVMLNQSHFRDYRFPKLQYVLQSGGSMPPQHVRELAKLLPDAGIYIMYGQREATALLTCLEPGELLDRPGSIGKPVPGVEIELVPEKQGPHGLRRGEIVAKGKNIMIGYWNDPEATGTVLGDGRLYTGDIGAMDEDGYLYFVGRKSDMIRSGAHWVSPKEVEDVIYEMNEVHEASVVGVRDTRLGEAIRAIVVLKEGCRLDAENVRRHCRTKLAPSKTPKEVLFVDSLPKSHSGKVMRYILKSKLAGSPVDHVSRAMNS
jgi:acyl-CoA synthetase (AMP-forming)/AMP-acid ligase II